MRCTTCKLDKPSENFTLYYRQPKPLGGRHCRSCRKSAGQFYRERHDEQIRAVHAVYRKTHRTKIIQNNKLRYQKLKAEVISAYGGKCACCSEQEPQFLTMDHKFGNGAEHRRQIGAYRKTGYNFYMWLKENGWPSDEYQLLCFNCNCAKRSNGSNGYCPHQPRVSTVASEAGPTATATSPRPTRRSNVSCSKPSGRQGPDQLSMPWRETGTN